VPAEDADSSEDSEQRGRQQYVAGVDWQTNARKKRQRENSDKASSDPQSSMVTQQA